MLLTLKKKYVTLPVSRLASSKKVCFYEDGELIFDLDCRLDCISPDFTAYVDVSPFAGKTVDLRIDPHMEVCPGQTEGTDLPDLFRERLRPQVHFTVPNGWNNDPNGLVRYNGEYHLFYQYNPCAPLWDNMHWGHAVSKDLLHWKHLDTALFPDESGMMYSGCGFEDKENRTGLGDGTVSPLLLYYTAAARTLLSKGKQYTQCLAYSLDGGRTVVKYAENPLVQNISKANRDPKVVYVEEIGRYVMALYLKDHSYRMFSSGDLLRWEPFSDLELSGDAECPDLYPLTCDGEKKWVFCGASDLYVVGRFTAQGFVPETEERCLQYSPVSYAAQSYSGIEDGRVIRIAWNRLSIPEDRFSQQMGFPVEMSLTRVEGQYLLSALPVREIEDLYMDGETFEDVISEEPLKLETGPCPVDLNLCLSGEYKSKIRIFGAVISLDPEANQLSFGKLKMPLRAAGDRINLRMIIDRCSLELYADGGRFCMTVQHLCDYNLPYVELSSRGAQNARIEWHKLRSVYDETV